MPTPPAVQREPAASPKNRMVDNAEYTRFVRRTIRALGRRAGAHDPTSLAELVLLRADLDTAIVDAVRELRADYSWAEIARELGITRQAAQQQWGPRLKSQACCSTSAAGSRTEPPPVPA